MFAYLIDVLEYRAFFSVELYKHGYVLSTCHEQEDVDLEGLRNINKLTYLLTYLLTYSMLQSPS